MARKTVIAEVTAALDTFSDAAICGSDGKGMLVASAPCAANAAKTVISAKVEETSGRGAAAIVETVSSAMAAPGEYDMIHIIQNGRGNLEYPALSCPDLIRASIIFTRNLAKAMDCRVEPGNDEWRFPCVDSQQARNTCAPSPTISCCRASETAGDSRITSACTPKIATAR